MRSNIKAIIINDTRVENHYGCYSVITNLIKILEKLNIEPIFFHPVGHSWADCAKFSKYIHQADIIIINGEGSIHHNNQRALLLANLAPFLKGLNKKSILINATLYQNSQELYDCLKYYDHIFLRDTASQYEAEKHFINSSYCPDLSFYQELDVLKNYHSLNSKKDILVGDSVIATVKNQLTSYLESKSLDMLDIFYTTENFNFEEHIEQLSSAKLVITGRYHTVCMCINLEIPFIAIESNTNKISALLMDCFGNLDRLIATEQIDESENLSHFFNFTENEAQEINIFKEKSKLEFNHLINTLAQLI